MSYLRPSSDVDFVRPVIACFVAVYGAEWGRGTYADSEPLLTIRPPRGDCRFMLPNLIAPVIVLATLLIPGNILFEAALSFLGLGVPPDQASWGQILADASGLYDVAWWLMVFPGLFLVLTTLSFNLLGDGLRDALDVRSDR